MKLWRRLGPGILLAATSIGASHLVLSPQAGALFGFDLLWLVLVAHLLKYPAFELGPRYAAATGRNLLQGYAMLPGPRGWAVSLFLLSTVLQGVGVLAGVVSVSGAVLHTWSGLSSMELLSVLLVAVVVLLLFLGGFAWLDHLNKLMMAVLALATLLAFLPIMPAPSDVSHLFEPALPAGSVVLVAAILGWMPTGLDVSVWHSFWTLEKLRNLGEDPHSSVMSSRVGHLRLALTDMRVGYVLSFATGVMFVCMGAVHLRGMGAQLKGVEFAQAISLAYTSILGAWMYHVFMLSAFFAMFSTSYVVIDGFSRSFSEAIALLIPALAGERARRRTYRFFVLFSASCAALTLVLVGNPVTLVTVVALVSLAIAPLIYGLNIFCVARHVRARELRPHVVLYYLGVAGTLLMVAALAVTFYVKVLI